MLLWVLRGDARIPIPGSPALDSDSRVVVELRSNFGRDLKKELGRHYTRYFFLYP